jgi:hypothetical protein
MSRKEAPDWGFWTAVFGLIQLALDLHSRFSAH